MKCTAAKCPNSKKKYPKFSCIKCKESFCSWHLLFLKEVKDSELDASQAQCLCCFLEIKRTPKFVDPGVADELAMALLKKNDAKFRDRVLTYRRGYEKSERDAFSTNGPQYWHPYMAPPPDADIKEFIQSTQK